MKNGRVAKKKFEKKKRVLVKWTCEKMHLKRFDDGGDPLRKRKEKKLKKIKNKYKQVRQWVIF